MRTRPSRCGTWRAARKPSPCAGTRCCQQPGAERGRQAAVLGELGQDDQGVGPGERQGNPHPARAHRCCHSLALSVRRQAARSRAVDDKTIKVWDLESGKETLTLRGHTDAVSSLALSVRRQAAVLGE